MKINEVVKKLKEGQIKPYILIAGTETFLVRHAQKAILAALEIQMPELNLSIFEDRPDMVSLKRAMETLPFMSERRVILIKNTDLLQATCAGQHSEPILKMNMPNTNILIICEQGKVDKRKALYKHIQKNGYIIECDKQDDASVANYVTTIAKRNNLLISGRNAQHLCELCGMDMEVISGELEKLISVCIGEITKAEIDEYTVKSIQYQAYKLHDYMVAKNIGQAKTLIDQMLKEDPNPIGMLTMLSNNFRQMLIARACKDAGLNEQRTVAHITQETGARDWAAKRAIANSRGYSAHKIRENLKALAQMDFDAKQGNVVLATDFFPLLVGIYM